MSKKKKEASSERAEKAKSIMLDKKKQEQRSRNIFAVSMILMVGLILGSVIWYIQANKVTTEINAVEPPGLTDNLGLVVTPEDLGGTTLADAKKVVIYEDFSCPYCEAFETANRAYLEEKLKDGEITLEYRLVTFLDESGGSTNEYSERAASAAYCVNDAGGAPAFLKFHDYLYQNQPQEGTAGPSSSDLYQAALDVDKNVDRTCVLSDKYAPWTDKADAKFNTVPDASGTPSIFVDGDYVDSNTIQDVLG